MFKSKRKTVKNLKLGVDVRRCSECKDLPLPSGYVNKQDLINAFCDKAHSKECYHFTLVEIILLIGKAGKQSDYE